jgi:hypothetical protein
MRIVLAARKQFAMSLDPVSIVSLDTKHSAVALSEKTELHGHDDGCLLSRHTCRECY